jgi:hypothetical protein
MKTVIAIDPGVNTGIVVAHVEEEVEILYFEQFICATHVETAQHIKQVLDAYPGAVIVAEQFDLRPGNKFSADLTPVKVNAILDYLVDDIHYQTPAQAKGLVKDATLKNLGWWLTGKDVGYKDANDVRDAFRHLVYYLVHEMRNKWTLDNGWPR